MRMITTSKSMNICILICHDTNRKEKLFFICELGWTYCTKTEMLHFFESRFSLENRYSVTVSLSYDIEHGTVMGNKRTDQKSQLVLKGAIFVHGFDIGVQKDRRFMTENRKLIYC